MKKIKLFIKTACIKIYNILPGKKIKCFIRNKTIESDKLSNIFMYEERNFSEYKLNEEYIENIKLINKKIIINLVIDSKNVDLNKIYNFLNQVNLKFDLKIYTDENINIFKIKKIIYLNNIEIINKTSESIILENYVKNYDYYIEIYYSKINDNYKYLIKNSINVLENYNAGKINFDETHIEECVFNSHDKQILKKIGFDSTLFIENYIHKIYDSKFYIVNINLIKRILEIDASKLNKKLLNNILDIYISKNRDKKIYYFENNYIEKKDAKFVYFNKEEFINKLEKYDIISFDIFDTLITRKVLKPDDVFYKMNEISKNNNFYESRKTSEEVARNKLNKDVNIYEIYEQLQEDLNLTDEEKIHLLNEEINLEFELCVSRKEMLEIIKSLKENNKKILLISDMYLPKDIILKMIHKCGYENLYDEIYVSNEYNARKDHLKLFEIAYLNLDKDKIIHIGDNIESDGKNACASGVSSIIIPKGTTYIENLKIISYGDSVIYGNTYNNGIYNSPFITDKNDIIFSDLGDFSYKIFGCIFINFMIWLNQIYNGDTYLFVAREGYYLKQLFEYFSKKTNIPLIENYYFLTSRRASSVPTLKNKEDIYELLNVFYLGTVKDLLFYRFGYIYNGDNFDIRLPNDIEKVKNTIENEIERILDNSKKEKVNYINYISSIIPDYKNKNLTVIDLGYSGTAQYYLTKLLGRKVDGNYFLVSENIKPLKLNCNVNTCFNKSIYDENNKFNFMYSNSMLLEGFLTSPSGQLLHFDDNNNPVYLDKKINDKEKGYLDEIYFGIKKYFDDVTDLLGSNILNYEYDRQKCIDVYQLFFITKNEYPEVFYEAFRVEDFYCENKIVNIITKK